MADDKLKTGPESPVLDHPGGGPAGDAQAVTKPPVPEEVEGPAAGTGPAPQPEQSVIPGMGKDAPAQPAPQVEAEKTFSSKSYRSRSHLPHLNFLWQSSPFNASSLSSCTASTSMYTAGLSVTLAFPCPSSDSIVWGFILVIPRIRTEPSFHGMVSSNSL